VGSTIVDLQPDLSAPDFAHSIDVLVEAGVTGLIGDHLDEPIGHDTTDQVRAVADRGLHVIATVACRSRTSHQAAARVAGLRHAGASAVLCVTGDHPQARFGGTHEVEFGLDSVSLASIARESPGCIFVAESPASPPTSQRPARLLTKQNAGADAAILNHAGTVDQLNSFAALALAAGVAMPLIAPVPVVTSSSTLTALTQFPGVQLPDQIHAVVDSADPTRAGISAAIEVGRRLLTNGLFAHLNLSGRVTNGGQLERARIMAGIADELGRSN